jgi:murein DD-endopeptidase MepM/ murein hydrolase activator NlpD
VNKIVVASMVITCLRLTSGFCGEVTVPSGLQQGDLVLATVTPGSRIAVDQKEIQVDKDGYFAFGLGRDYPDDVIIKAWFADGTTSIQTHTVLQRTYGEQRIRGLPEQMVTPDQKLAERIAWEADLVREARSHTTSTNFFRSGLIWPVNGTITGVFGTRRILNGEVRSPHYGIDIAATDGTTVLASADGIVRLSAELYLSGNTTVLDHGHGISSTYLHMKTILVSKNDFIRQGEVIGYVGSTGRSTGAHLDWRINWFKVRVDPERALIFFSPNPRKN